MSPCSTGVQERTRLVAHWVCKACNGPRLGCGAVDVHLQQRSGLHKPLTFVSGGFPGLISHDLLECLDSSIVSRDLCLGTVFGPNNEPLTEWSTFHGRYRLIIRGTQNAGHRICEECHRDLYFATGTRYLFPTPPHDAEIFESDLSGLVLSPALYDRIDFRKWRKKIHVDKLYVVNKPLDGLGVIPPQ